MAPSSQRTRAQVVADDQAQLAADQAAPDTQGAASAKVFAGSVPEPDTADGASAEARKQQIANSKARADALAEATVIAKEVADAREKEGIAHAAHVAAQAKHAEALARAEAAGRKPLDTPSGMIITAAGLPNSCTVCGKTIAGPLWYAFSDDAARAGMGYCAADAQIVARVKEEQAGPIGARTVAEKSVANQTDLQAKEDATRT